MLCTATTTDAVEIESHIDDASGKRILLLWSIVCVTIAYMLLLVIVVGNGVV